MLYVRVKMGDMLGDSLVMIGQTLVAMDTDEALKQHQK